MDRVSSLLDLSYEDLVGLLAEWGQPRYRADQIWDWVYRKLATDARQMSNLPGELRARLAALTVIDPLERLLEQRSADGQTIKWLFRLPALDAPVAEAATIETVLMFYDEAGIAARDRRTVCISTQAGCAMGCAFCATGQGGLARNLTAGEIVAQVLAAARWLRDAGGQRPGEGDGASSLASTSGAGSARRLTHVVVMGMGEPFANFEALWEALRRITDPRGFGLGARHITVSTVGLPQGIRRMTEEPLHPSVSAGQINLAISLHAPNDTLRSQLVPVNRRYPIAALMAAVQDYIARTNRRVTFEYALIDGVNDAPELARELAGLLRPLRAATGAVLCHVNLIPLNPVPHSSYCPSPPPRVAAFQAILEKAGIPTTVRSRRGLDIDAGCGQLRRRILPSR